MPPTDNAPTPPPAPTPEGPKKPGFFARLFGKKEKEPEFPDRPSQTPPPRLDDTADGTPSPDGTSATPVDATGAPAPAPEEKPPTLDVPPSLQADPPAPAVSIDPLSGVVSPVGGDVPGAVPSEESKDDTPKPPTV